MQFDETDEAIIALLIEDGRLSNRAIGREIGVSEGAVRKRLKRMIESDAISYGLLVDVAASEIHAGGFLSVEVHPANASEVADAIRELELCSLCALTSGRYNVLAYIYARNVREIAAIIERISKIHGVRSTKFRQPVEVVSHRHEFALQSDVGRVAPWVMKAGNGDEGSD